MRFVFHWKADSQYSAAWNPPNREIAELRNGHCGGGKDHALLVESFAPGRIHALENEVSEKVETRYGVRYEINGRMTAPDGSVLNVRSAWFIDDGSEKPRFITAHPLPKP